jgi:hypothetical protein
MVSGYQGHGRGTISWLEPCIKSISQGCTYTVAPYGGNNLVPGAVSTQYRLEAVRLIKAMV